jgi:hypothetical protein
VGGSCAGSGELAAECEKLIPFGDENQRGKSKSKQRQQQIPDGMTNKRAKAAATAKSEQKRFPWGVIVK